jgi:hypothetical protein
VEVVVVLDGTLKEVLVDLAVLVVAAVTLDHLLLMIVE